MVIFPPIPPRTLQERPRAAWRSPSYDTPRLTSRWRLRCAAKRGVWQGEFEMPWDYQLAREGRAPDGAGIDTEITAALDRLTGNGSNPTWPPIHPGCCRTAPFRPHFEQRADRRSMALEASGPHRMMKDTNAMGERCRQCSHTTQHQGVPRRSCSSVGRGGSRSMPARLAQFTRHGKPRGLA